MKRWSIIFKILGNINRLKIVSILNEKGGMYVGDIATKLDISIKATSKHLILFGNLDVLEYKGQSGHVLYYINPVMPEDIKKVLKLFLK
ncbi:MAG: helix-turn-helix transcriptional regulator [Patescibacteria group bacterium]